MIQNSHKGRSGNGAPQQPNNRVKVPGKAQGRTRVTKSTYEQAELYSTKDGSLIRELMHPDVHGNANQSLAEAIVPVRSTTLLHKHLDTEEIYHITAGRGRMTVADETFEVTVGDTICIPPGTPHKIQNTGTISLKLLCCCAPPYSHNDTEVLKNPGSDEG